MPNKLSGGGNAIPESTDIAKEDVTQIVHATKRELPPALFHNVKTDIGSAGYKERSNDIDLMLDEQELVNLFNTQASKSPVLAAKKSLEEFFKAKGFKSKVSGRIVHVGMPYHAQGTGDSRLAQVDLMFVPDVDIVAEWHQHGLRGQYNNKDFKGDAVFILMNSIGKFLGLKFDAFGGKLMRRDNNEVVARSRDEVAKMLLNDKATGKDLDSVKTILAALKNDPDKDKKLEQAREDQSKGILTLHEDVVLGTSAWYRQTSEMFS